MALTVPDEGLIAMAMNALGTPGAESFGSLLVDLYQNNYVPDYTSTASDFVIATFDGYTQVIVPIGNMVPTLIPPEFVTLVNSNNPISWMNLGTDTTVYGYLVRAANGGVVLWAEAWGPTSLAFKKTISFNLELDVTEAS